nr:T9SS type A sorting domain-containing protein [candidate division Zixibacteria bacterium]
MKVAIIISIFFMLAMFISLPAIASLSIGTMHPDGNNKHLICVTENNPEHVHWSPDLTKVTYFSNIGADGYQEIYLYDINQGITCQLTDYNESYAQASSRFYDNSTIWYRYHQSSGNISEYRDISFNGCNVMKTSTLFTQTEWNHLANFDLSDNYICFGVQMGSNGNTEEIFLTPKDNIPDYTQLTTNSLPDRSPDISADETKIVYLHAYGAGRTDNIFVMDIDGANKTQLTFVPDGSVYGPHLEKPLWSPNGTQICYSYHDGSQWDIYIMDSDGTNAVNITNTVDFDERVWDWNNDEILFTTDGFVPGMLAYYSFEENANDQTGNGFDGVINGDVSYGEGACGVGAYFDGEGDYIEIPAEGVLSFDAATDSYTISLWFKATSLIPGCDYCDYILIKDRNPENYESQSYGISIDLHNPDSLQLIANIWDKVPNMNWVVKSGFETEINRPYHITEVVKAGISHELYINGHLIDSLDITGIGHTDENDGSITVGAGWYPNGWQYFTGMIDEIRIYNFALSEEEIDSIYGLCNPDSLFITSIESCLNSDGTFEIPVKIKNKTEITGYNIPIIYDYANATYFGYSLEGTLCEGWTGDDTVLSENQFVLGFIDGMGMNSIPPESDDILINLIFRSNDPTSEICEFDLVLDTTLSDDVNYHLAFSDAAVPPKEYVPAVKIDTSYIDNYIPGDVNRSGGVNILDATTFICYLYKDCPEPVCPKAGDPNGDCATNILDVTYLINYLYRGGPAPVCGCVGEGSVEKTAVVMLGTIETFYDNGKTYISLNSPIDIMAVEFGLITETQESLNIRNLANGMELYYRQEENRVRGCLVDISGKTMIKAGSARVLELDGMVELTHVLGSDIKAQGVGFAIANHPANDMLPMEYTLSQNHPNPFNPVTEIEFSLPKSGDVSLAVYDILGRKVETLVDDYLEAGNHTAVWDASRQASGIYFYRLIAGEFKETRKMTLIK